MSKPNRGVEVKNGETVDRALKRLKTKLDSEGILEEMRRRRAHESNTIRNIRKARTAPKRYKVRWKYISEGTDAKRAEAKAASE
ncbi:MAG: 30S ribosomal protein S21 [Verrucomicrobiaceae bacterium]